MTILSATRIAAGRGWTAALDALLPPRCLACPEPVDRAGALCAACWTGLSFISAPFCACCGTPFPFDAAGAEMLCADCLRERPRFDRARAVWRYDDGSRPLVLAFKHGDRTHMAPALGRWLMGAGGGLLAEADLVTPVPLHWTRLFRRRFNQAALLARAAAGLAGRPLAPDLLVRRRSTGSQGGRGRAGRRRNVQGAFAVHPAWAEAVGDRRILLVDDVLTTGATVDACAGALLSAGAAAVDVLTLARVVRTGD